MNEQKNENGVETEYEIKKRGDLSLWFLLFSNIITIFFAIIENWNLSTIMWIYWFQSITIGCVNFIRILQLKEFSTDGLQINKKPVEATQGTKNFTAFFFLIHFGLFHFVYVMFFLNGTFINSAEKIQSVSEIKYILVAVLIFFINHLFSYFYNKSRDTKKQNLGALLFNPYIRVIPMHLTISFFTLFNNALPLFLILKTFADAIMHVVEHNALRKSDLKNKNLIRYKNQK